MVADPGYIAKKQDAVRFPNEADAAKSKKELQDIADAFGPLLTNREDSDFFSAGVSNTLFIDAVTIFRNLFDFSLKNRFGSPEIKVVLRPKVTPTCLLGSLCLMIQYSDSLKLSVNRVVVVQLDEIPLTHQPAYDDGYDGLKSRREELARFFDLVVETIRHERLVAATN